MTRQEIEAKISTIRNNNALPEKQKGMLLDKYEKMLVDATIGDSDAGKIAPAKEKKAPAPRKPRTPKEPKVTAPKTPAMGEPDCDDLFEQDRERKAKAAIAAEKRRNAPKKTEATKNKEAVEKASAKVEKSVEKRIKSGDVSVAEIKKIIEEYETALKKLRQLLTRAEGKMKFGGPVKDQDISKLADKARDISNHHCGCNDKYEGGGDSGDNYGGQRDKIVAELKSMKGGLDSKAPKVFLKNGLIYVSAENDDNYADYYQYSIDEQLEELADKYDTYWDWEDAGAIVLSPIDSYARGGAIKIGDRVKSTTFKGISGTILSKNKAGYYFVRLDETLPNGDYQHEVLRIDEVEKMSTGGSMYAGGGGTEERYNLSFNYNPGNLSNKDAERMVSHYTKDWKRNNDPDEVSFHVQGLNKKKVDDLKEELEMEDTYNIEIEKSRYAGGGSMYKDGGIAYKDAVAEFNDELREHYSIKKLAENYNKTPIEVVKHLQPRIKTKGNRAGKTVEVSIDFTDTNTNINTKHVKKFGGGGSMPKGWKHKMK